MTRFPSPLASLARRRRTFGLAVCTLGLLALTAPARRTESYTAPGTPGAAEPRAEQEFHNVQALKGMPASQMYPVMYLMRSSLGVSCSYCHAAENERFELDTKPEKQIARQMIKMTEEINRTYFAGQTEVTCNSCHYGKRRPVTEPPIGQGAVDDTARGGLEARPALPTATQLLERYLAVSGGRARLAAVTRRVSRGTVLRSKLVNPGTPQMRRINRGQQDPIELVQSGANQLTIVVGPPAARIVERFDGKAGTIETSQGKRSMSPLQISHVTEVAELHPQLELRERADRMRVVGKDRIAGREVYVVRGATADGRPQTLYFDIQSGFLTRRLVLTPTVLGLDPEQFDYTDYRDAGGLKLPFVVKTSYLNDDDLGSTLHWTEIRSEPGPAKP